VDYTEEQKAHFKLEFATRRKRQMILAVPLVVLVLLAVASDRSGAIFGIPREAIGIGFFIFVVCGLIFSLRNWRCPACDRYLGKGTPSYCPKCGVQLQ
jgi:hypothetical protein